MVDFNKLQGKIPVDIFPSLVDAMKKFGIDTPLHVSHFLSQAMHESGNFKAVSENLNYSAQGLRATFGKYFPDDVTANAYARQPQKIANKVYASRMGNGDEKSGEGFKFRGRGYIQLTGKNNYIALGKALNEDLTINPDLVATPKYASLSAAWFFSKTGLNVVADKGATKEVIMEVTKKINGGLNGINERVNNFNNIYKLLSE